MSAATLQCLRTLANITPRWSPGQTSALLNSAAEFPWNVDAPPLDSSPMPRRLFDRLAALIDWTSNDRPCLEPLSRPPHCNLRSTAAFRTCPSTWPLSTRNSACPAIFFRHPAWTPSLRLSTVLSMMWKPAPANSREPSAESPKLSTRKNISGLSSSPAAVSWPSNFVSPPCPTHPERPSLIKTLNFALYAFLRFATSLSQNLLRRGVCWGVILILKALSHCTRVFVYTLKPCKANI